MMHFALTLAAEGAESPSALDALGINAWGFLSQLISFLIVFIILGVFVLPAIQKTLDKRQQVIREGVENAEKAKQALEDAQQTKAQIIADARKDAQAIIEKADKDAQRISQQIEEEARARAEQYTQQQIARIQQEANRARNELSRVVVGLSMNAAEKVIGKNVDNNDNRRMVEEFVTSSNQARNN